MSISLNDLSNLIHLSSTWPWAYEAVVFESSLRKVLMGLAPLDFDPDQTPVVCAGNTGPRLPSPVGWPFVDAASRSCAFTSLRKVPNDRVNWEKDSSLITNRKERPRGKKIATAYQFTLETSNPVIWYETRLPKTKTVNQQNGTIP